MNAFNQDVKDIADEIQNEVTEYGHQYPEDLIAENVGSMEVCFAYYPAFKYWEALDSDVRDQALSEAKDCGMTIESINTIEEIMMMVNYHALESAVFAELAKREII